ncbi:MAG: hypothetical protein RBR15_12860 [Sphaerochaeta sp.]|nr:hypothetical protein [Sphaerochaeta sp.]
MFGIKNFQTPVIELKYYLVYDGMWVKDRIGWFDAVQEDGPACPLGVVKAWKMVCAE